MNTARFVDLRFRFTIFSIFPKYYSLISPFDKKIIFLFNFLTQNVFFYIFNSIYKFYSHLKNRKNLFIFSVLFFIFL